LSVDLPFARNQVVALRDRWHKQRRHANFEQRLESRAMDGPGRDAQLAGLQKIQSEADLLGLRRVAVIAQLGRDTIRFDKKCDAFLLARRIGLRSTPLMDCRSQGRARRVI
jgi:hypothetical protein